MTDYIHVSAGGEVSYIPGDYIVTCDEETASWIGNDADSMRLLVRCRDCKFCMAYIAGTYCDYMAHSVELDGFCAWGKPKEGDAE